VRTLEQAEDLAARILAAIDLAGWDNAYAVDDYCRERVASDLDGLRKCLNSTISESPTVAAAARRFSDDLLRTAALYGVTP
jgi:hypothetical protein